MAKLSSCQVNEGFESAAIAIDYGLALACRDLLAGMIPLGTPAYAVFTHWLSLTAEAGAVALGQMVVQIFKRARIAQLVEPSKSGVPRRKTVG